jgi:ABC-type bacteriocin/lantibiotic exporter with double-glycine peptidase domain
MRIAPDDEWTWVAPPRPVPFVQQLTDTDCAAACLAMTLAAHGRAVPLEALLDARPPGRDGWSARDVVAVARTQGLAGQGLALDAEGLAHLPAGSILHWEGDHFVVWAGRGEIVDPAVGRLRPSAAERAASFSGVALVFTPAPEFRPLARRSRLPGHLRRALADARALTGLVLASLLLQVAALAVPVCTGLVVDRVVPAGELRLLTLVGAGLLAVVVAGAGLSWARGLLLARLRARVDERLTLGFLEHLVALPYAFFQRRPAGDLLARVGSNGTLREVFTMGLLSGAVDAVFAAVYLALLLAADRRLFAATLALAALHGAVGWWPRRRRRELTRRTLGAQARAQGELVGLLQGIEALKAMGAEARAVARYGERYREEIAALRARDRLEALCGALAGALSLAGPLALLILGAALVVRGELGLGEMLALVALANGFLGPLAGLVHLATQVEVLRGSVDRVDDVLAAAPERGPEAAAPPALSGRVALEGVTFRYTPRGPAVLSDVSLAVEPGALVAIVGRTGSGKSTLAHLLLGLHPPEAGRVLVDGADLAALDVGAVRRQIGVVTQRPWLFGGTVRENIAVVRPDAPASAVERAARLACIHDEIAAMPMGYETRTGDGGGSLSGGQRQRVALARALLGEPAILVLDEATSALDGETEARVHAALESLRCTRVVITHRLATLRRADRVFVLDAGRVVEQGTHAELAARGGLYAALLAP